MRASALSSARCLIRTWPSSKPPAHVQRGGLWDGNETWLVIGGTLLLATFPAGYDVLLSAFYLPIMALLFAIIFRGIALGFRLRRCSRARRRIPP